MENTMSEAIHAELLQLNQRLLDCIGLGDWATYQELCDPSLTAIEPEASGQIVEGLGFHHYYFELGGIRGKHQNTMCSPRVRLMGDVAVIAYVRLVQRIGPEGAAITVSTAETRVWQRRDGRWRHVHFHRSALPS
jgi:calcium/calmodulin-dependent protein kinase (CaM kinase) II